MNSSATRRFHKLCLSTLVAVYILILVGGIVRSTGSGMGCPDWPTCFGKLIPPTSVDQLPSNYKEEYAAFRQKKNEKFARYLSLVGLNETADKLVNDRSILIEADFNATKTWVEYINRLVGVIIGLLIIALFVSSWKTRSVDPRLFKGALATLILVIFQGWFGSIVVSTNLTAWTITVHMFLALLMVAILIWLMVNSSETRGFAADGNKSWLLRGMFVVFIQIFLGTQVREQIDRVASSLPREEWISHIGVNFAIHRTFSWVVVWIVVGIWFKLRKTSAKKSLTLTPFLLILSSLLTGVGMAYGGVPVYLQPVHLVIAVITFGWLYQVYLESNNSRSVEVNI
ncbi:MAG TPA: COX15/CtaA family protein [Cyclobacteriaceae bacterium]|nr:COX15/CtaA family protein [Cyclobacteriaceae bacterium]